jgi:DNA topoisomerase-1
LKLYRLIWQRFVASQMMPAIFDVTTAKIAANSSKTNKTYDFRVSGSVLRFDGFLKVYEVAEEKGEEDDESKNKLPSLEGVKALALEKLEPEDHFTSPPPRYNEASLVKILEERGIGRPSTYASIINTIQDREYVTKITGRFFPTEIGVVVCDLLVENFPYIFDSKYTARLEEELDDIEEGKEKWTDLLNGFYDHFEEELVVAEKSMRDIKRMEIKTDEKCDLCGSPLLLKWGKFGSFYACSAYNKKDPTSCTFTKENTAAKPDLNTPEAQDATEQEEYCENCGKVMVLRRGPFGMFMSCPDYNADPPCKTFRKLSQKQQQKQSAPQPTGEDCPQCGKPLVLRQGAYGEFVSCSGYPKCKYVKQNLIEGMKCPKCGTGDIAERKAKRGNIFWGCTNYPKCDFTSNYKPVPQKCPECGSAYLLEKTLKDGIFLECPNKKRGTEEETPAAKKRGKKT